MVDARRAAHGRIAWRSRRRERRLSYRELDRLAGAGARELGVAPGSRVAIALAPGTRLRRRAARVPARGRGGRAGRPARADALAGAGERRRGDRPRRWSAPEARSPASEHELDATALLIVRTSGTSGEPKEVPLTYGNLLWSAIGSAVALGLDPRERWLCTLPLVHVGGLSIIVRSAIYGTTAVVHERFDLDAALEALMEREITIVSVVATTLTRLLDGGLARPAGAALRARRRRPGPGGAARAERARPASSSARPTGSPRPARRWRRRRRARPRVDAGPPLFCTRVALGAGRRDPRQRTDASVPRWRAARWRPATSASSMPTARCA